MATGGAIKAGRAYVELFSDDNALTRGLTAASKKLQAWGASVSKVGSAFMTLGVIDLVKGIAGLAILGKSALDFAAFGAELQHASERTGATVEALSALSFAAHQSGASFEDLEVGIKKMQKTLGEAELGSAEAQKALGKLGVTMGELKGKTPDEQLIRLADGAAGLANDALRTDAAMAVFGRGGAALIPLLRQGADGIRQMKQEAEDLGVVMSSQSAQDATRMTEAIGKLKAQLHAAWISIGAALAPALTQLAGEMKNALKSVIDFVKENPGLVTMLAKAAALSVACGVAQIVLGGAFKVAGLGLFLFSVAIKAVVVLLAVLKASLLVLATLPGIIIGAMVGLVGAMFFASDEGKHVAGTFAKSWTSIKDTAVTAWGGIVDAIKAGDLGLAGQIGMLALKIVWMNVLAALKELWFGFTGFFVRIWQDAMAGFSFIFTTIWAGLQTAWVNVVAFLAGVWFGFVRVLELAWAGVMLAIKKTAAATVGGVGGKLLSDAADLENQQRVEEIEKQNKARKEGVRKDLEQKEGAIEKDRQDAIKALGDDLANKEKARKADQDKRAADAAAEVAEARKQLDALVDEAAKKRKQKEDEAGKAGKKPPPGTEQLTGGGNAGTFSAFAAASLGGSNIPQQQLNAQLQLVAQNQQVIVLLRQLGVFP